MRAHRWFFALALLLLSGIAYAQYYIQTGAQYESYPAVAANQILVRNDTNTGWSAVPRLPTLSYSAKVTGTGGSQSTAHGLGVVPRICAAQLVVIPAIATVLLAPTTLITAGAHTSTNCVFTVLSGADYYVLAVA